MRVQETNDGSRVDAEHRGGVGSVVLVVAVAVALAAAHAQ